MNALSSPVLSLAAARRTIETGLAHAASLQVADVAIAIVDAGANLLAFARSDDCFCSSELSQPCIRSALSVAVNTRLRIRRSHQPHFTGTESSLVTVRIPDSPSRWTESLGLAVSTLCPAKPAHPTRGTGVRQA